ncbi:hypothetical protein N658DRAFT_60438 [Parathielavia hyrcaniae]|uniref:Uncharacterized protein n=1 Tax=Parathielavia hyrcaniae TaxID=113614 RepID=A0AAN6Q374_9PEZI|nr:hypothetical protein N658DRAFT_60438 [Parathielavia hyrcaniae]
MSMLETTNDGVLIRGGSCRSCRAVLLGGFDTLKNQALTLLFIISSCSTVAWVASWLSAEINPLISLSAAALGSCGRALCWTVQNTLPISTKYLYLYLYLLRPHLTGLPHTEPLNPENERLG